MMEDVDPKELCTQSSQKEKLQQQGNNLQEEDVASSIQVGAKGLVVEPLEKENILQPVKGLSEKLRVKTPRWQPPEGTRRCGHNCIGCSKKCAEQGLEDCHNCHIKNNIEKKTGEKVMSHICFNRGECVNPRELRGRSISKGGMAKTKVLYCVLYLSQGRWPSPKML